MPQPVICFARRRVKLWGGKDSCTSQRLWGGNPTIHIERYTEIGGSHMSRKHSTALGISAAISGAAVAAFLGMGMAHAEGDADFYEDVFGGPGTAGLSAAQIRDNVALDEAA